jgi:hypothetical protein
MGSSYPSALVVQKLAAFMASFYILYYMVG